MKKYLYLISPLLILLAISCQEPSVKISADFDKGSIGDLTEAVPNHLTGTTKHWLKRDSIGDQYYWFYFKAEQVKNKRVTFELKDLIGVYRETPHIVYTDYTQPVYSYDQQNWHRITNVKYDSASHTFQFTEHFEKEPVWIAYAHPYPTSRIDNFLDRIKSSEYAEINQLAKTKEGRDISLVHITDTDIPEGEKKTIFILALQHAGEDAGGFMAEGLIQFLLSEEEEAKLARKRFNYLIVPMMNPDGIYNGTSRYNMEMEDLNNVWLNDEKEQPEVTGLKKWADSWIAAGNEIDLFIDIHNHTQFHQYNVLIFQDHELDSLVTIMERYWPIRIWHSEFKGSSCSYFYKMGVPSGTIELSQSHLADGKYLTIEDYFSFGKGTVLALNEFYID
jgi:hypothetical protein